MTSERQQSDAKRPRREDTSATPTTSATRTTVAPARAEEDDRAQRRRIWLARTLRQHMHRQLPLNVRRAGSIIQEAAAGAASFCLAKGRTTAAVDEAFIHFLSNLHDNRILAAANGPNAPHQLFGRYERAAADYNQQPRMSVLRTAQPDAMQRWRRAMANMIRQAQQYRRRHNPAYRINVMRWVSRDTWRHISTRLLHPNERTTQQQLDNDTAVAYFLLQVRQYDSQANSLVQRRIMGALTDGMFYMDRSDRP